ncbi:hypothetical protein [Bacillus pumilus]|uniref:hypothetical protein n=1 Tax=Bacillus pumilus TaxID=1408 RepID=UPI00119FF746|nr:hypothetical protein [Bacillus pumilus]
MNKRQVRKYKKKLLEGVPEDHGIVINNKGSIRHHFHVGEVVKIVSEVRDWLLPDWVALECENRFGMRQTLSSNQIVTHDDIRRKKK